MHGSRKMRFQAWAGRRWRSLRSPAGAAFLVFAVVLCLVFIRHADELFSYKTGEPTVRDAVQMANGVHYTETLSNVDDCVRAVALCLGTNGRQNAGTLTLRLMQDDEVLYTWTVDSASVLDREFALFDVGKLLHLDPDRPLTLDLVNDYPPDTENNLAFYTSRGGEGTLSSGEAIPGTFCMQWTLLSAAERDRFLPVYTALMILLMLAAACLIDFSTVRWYAPVLAGLIMLFALQFADYDLLGNLNTVILRQVYDSTSKNTVELAPGDAAEFALAVNGPFDRIEWFAPDRAEGIRAELVRADIGDVTLSRNIHHWLDDKRAAGVGATFASTQVLSPGDYRLRIENLSEETVRFFALKDGNLNAIVEQRSFLAQRLLMLVGFMMAFATLFVWRCTSGRSEPTRLYVAMAVPLALAYFVLFLPWSPPDTRVHFMAAYRWSNLLLGVEESAGRQEDVRFFTEVWREDNPSMPAYGDVLDRLHLKCIEPEYTEMPRAGDMDYYSVFNYLPEAVGLALGRALGLGTVVCVYLARFLVMLAYLAVTWRAVRHSPMGKGVLAVLALLPISLMMSGAISYDPLVIAVSLAFYAAVFDLMRRPDSRAALGEAMLWCALLGALKGGGYVCLLPVALLLAKRERRTWLNIGGLTLAAACSVVLFDLILPQRALFQFGTEGNGMLTTAYALSHPLKYLNMAAEAYLAQMDYILVNIGGTHLAWLEKTLPTLVVMSMLFLGVTFSMFESDEIVLDRRQQKLLLLVAAAGFIGTPVMLMSSTRAAANLVEGIQGRYFLPFMPALMLALTKLRLHHPLTGRDAWAVHAQMWRAFWALSLLAVYFMLRLYLTR